MNSIRAYLTLVWLLVTWNVIEASIVLPNTTGIDGQLTANLNIDNFFSLWLAFNNDDVKMSDAPFTIFAPQNAATIRAKSFLNKPELIKKVLLDHVVLEKRIDLSNASTGVMFNTIGGRTISIRPFKEDMTKLKANEVNIVDSKFIIPNGLIVVVDNYLFLPYNEEQQESNETQEKLKEINNFSDTKETFRGRTNSTFVDNIMEVLSYLKSGVRVFQHFLSRSNVSRLLLDDEEYTVFVPTDHAFQRWHPIDWGFYPFSVPEFTESVIVNHFIKGRLKQDMIKDGLTLKTIGGKEVTFRRTTSLMVNGATIVKGDTPVTKGNIMFIGEVLFVSESVVSKLHQQHKDKETPPLLAFPWFGAQFLSHAFLALERDKRFSHITRFLNLADLAPHVSGTGYTFFVPIDSAFEELGLDKMPDNYLSTGDGLQILLNHFVKGRLYDKDLMDKRKLTTLGSKVIAVERINGNVKINDATIVESEVFVYNLGTMFYIDKVLFTSTNNRTTTSSSIESTQTPNNGTRVTEEATEGSGFQIYIESSTDIDYTSTLSTNNTIT